MKRFAAGFFTILCVFALTGYNMGIYKASQRNLTYGIKAERFDALLANVEFTLDHINSQLPGIMSFQRRVIELETATTRLVEASRSWDTNVTSIQEQVASFDERLLRLSRPELIQLEELRNKQEALEDAWWEQQHNEQPTNVTLHSSLSQPPSERRTITESFPKDTSTRQ